MPAKSSEVSKPSNLKTFLLTHQDRSTLNTVWAQTLQPHVPLSENTYNSELGLVAEASICNNKDLKKCDIPVNIQPETDINGTNTDNSLSEAIKSTFSNLLNKFLFKMPNDLKKFVDDSVTLDTDCNFTSQSQKNVNKIYVSQKTNKTIVGKDAATEESKEYDNHNATDGSVCRVCDINCGSLELLQDHLKRTRFICRVCIEEFSNHKELESHFFAHKKYSCRVCKEKFSDRKRLLKHRRTSDSCSYRHQCDSCGKQMSNKNSLRKHKLAFHSDSREAIVCIICRKDFTSPVLLNSHLQSCHTVYEQVECNTCQKLFLGPERLKIHIRAAHLDFDEHYGCACSTCNKRFSNIHNLKKHLKTHDAGGFLCKICGELFKGKGSRRRHMLRVHSKPGQFVCKTCNEQFDLEENLVIHRKRFHSNRSIPHPVYCEICGKQYKSETTLKIHRFIHLDEKLFQCDTCGASFKQSITLKNHKRVHSSVDKYSCKNCEKTFRWKQTFDKHVKKCLIYTNDKI